MKIRKPLTVKNLYQYVNDYDIFKFYCLGFSEMRGKRSNFFKSPFRDESKASAVIYSTSSGNLRFNDFVLPTMSSVEFVSNYYNLSFSETLKKIALDFRVSGLFVVDWGNTPLSTIKPTKYNKTIQPATDTTVQVRYRKWQQHDIDYWSSFGISLETLDLFHVYPIDYFWVNGNRIKADKHSYTYNYYWENNVYRRKIYQPFNTDDLKWISNGGKIVQGEGVLPKKGNLLIITKGLKDVMCLYEMGYTSIAPTTEKTLPSKEYIDKQKERFKKTILFLDNDETGIQMSKKHSLDTNIPYILIPQEYECKDISDFVKKYGIEKGKKLLKSLKLNYEKS
jgi:hypothetical protein